MQCDARRYGEIGWKDVVQCDVFQFERRGGDMTRRYGYTTINRADLMVELIR